jgi:hypothetical protein
MRKDQALRMEGHGAAADHPRSPRLRRGRHSAGWLLAAIGLAAGLSWVTFVGSVLNSCGAGNHGPNPGAEEEFCGYGSDDPTHFSTLFVFVNLVPAVPILIGGLLPVLRFSRLFFPAGVVLGVAATALIWALEP